jgi:hypothetical protein
MLLSKAHGWKKTKKGTWSSTRGQTYYERQCVGCSRSCLMQGRPSVKYCSHFCYLKNRLRHGTNNSNWKGGSHVDIHGYRWVYNANRKSHNGHYVKEHRQVMEKHLGRLLKSSEHIHHVNGIKTDNRIENLVLTNISEHSRHHNLVRWHGKGFLHR